MPLSSPIWDCAVELVGVRWFSCAGYVRLVFGSSVGFLVVLAVFGWVVGCFFWFVGARAVCVGAVGGLYFCWPLFELVFRCRLAVRSCGFW